MWTRQIVDLKIQLYFECRISGKESDMHSTCAHACSAPTSGDQKTSNFVINSEEPMVSEHHFRPKPLYFVSTCRSFKVHYLHHDFTTQDARRGAAGKQNCIPQAHELCAPEQLRNFRQTIDDLNLIINECLVLQESKHRLAQLRQNQKCYSVRDYLAATIPSRMRST